MNWNSLQHNQSINQTIYLRQYVGWGCPDHPSHHHLEAIMNEKLGIISQNGEKVNEVKIYQIPKLPGKTWDCFMCVSIVSIRTVSFIVNLLLQLCNYFQLSNCLLRNIHNNIINGWSLSMYLACPRNFHTSSVYTTFRDRAWLRIVIHCACAVLPRLACTWILFNKWTRFHRTYEIKRG